MSASETQNVLQSRFLAAGSGTLITSFVVNPFDVVRVRMQKYSAIDHMPAISQSIPNMETKCCKDMFWYPNTREGANFVKKPRSLGTLSVFRTIASTEGPLVLWRGVSLLLAQSLPANVIYFISYEHGRDWLASFDVKFLNQLSPLIAGGTARALASTIV